MLRIVTTNVFLRRGDEILLAMKKRGHGEGHWNGAGGKPDPGETIEQTMVREAQEEIGVTPLRYEKIAEYTIYQRYKGEPCENIGHLYFCTGWDGEPTESDEMAPRWFTLSDIPYDHMWPDVVYAFPRLLAGTKVRATFRYDDANQLISHEITEVADFS
jgi:8-oxo-dGTP pyrophosphatase MutT (NUDIX family)